MRKFLVTLVAALVLSGCGDQSVLHPNEKPIPGASIEPAIAALTNTIGTPDTVYDSNQLSREQAIEAATEYGSRTGKWFKSEDGFNLITGISSEVVQAGGRASAAVKNRIGDRSVRFQLTRRDAAGKRIELVAEYTGDQSKAVFDQIDFWHAMPNTPNTNYLLSIEIITKENVAEDTLISPLFVPPNEIHASLSVKAPDANADNAELTLYNAGPANLYFGYGYALYRQTPDGWIGIPLVLEVPAIGIQLKPGESYQEKATFRKQLAPGIYRLVKTFSGQMTDLSVTLGADFEIR